MLENNKKTIKKIVIAATLFVLTGYLSLVFHELGHSLVYVSYNMKIKQIVVFPGIELYPVFGKKIFYKSIVYGSVKLEDYTYPASAAQNGFALFMGSGLNAIMSILATVSLRLFKPKRIAAITLLFITLWIYDILIYSFNNDFRGAEPINGLVMMGLSSSLAYVAVISISFFSILSSILYVKNYLLEKDIL